MLLGKKTKVEIESEWALILDRSTNEFTKNRVAEKLAQLFSLSNEEGKDLIENTPIILLDHMPLESVEKIKEQLSQWSIDCSLTNDTFTKRKCFRAVWPEQPDLDRLLNKSSSDPILSSEGPVPVNRGSHFGSEVQAPLVNRPQEQESRSSEEEHQLRELTLDLQKENEMLKAQLEKADDVAKEKENQRFNSEMERLKAERARFEESTARLKGENTALVSKLDEVDRKLREMKRVQDEMEPISFAKSQFTELKTQLDHYKAEYTRAQNGARLAQNEAKQFQAEWLETQKSLSEARAEVEDLKRMLNQVQSSVQPLREESERLRQEMENRDRALTSELEEWKRKANDWSASYFKVIKENEFLRAHQSEELESLKVRNQQLATQLELAQRQVKDYLAKSEQQELIQKRMKAAQELGEHEGQLRTLVQKQQTLEEEIRVREEEMKKVLAEQEMVEQEIMKSKQAQKYLMEQAKLREKSRLVRQKGTDPNFSSPQDFTSLKPTSE
ncbi:MAG: hypothetical protein HY584_00240 [Candidatus Omnitrophica bacterium]|nr:hypothetical protein [Candidatus Omnitrophota bacterium]